MEYLILPIERFGELEVLYDMSGFREKRYENLKKCREICIVAEEDGRLCGEVNIMIRNSNIPAAVVPNRRVYLFGLHVVPEHRHKGVATALVSNAVRLAAQRGIFEVTIGVEKGNTAARRLYEKLGFTSFLDDCVEYPNGKECRFDLLMLRL